MSELFLEKMGKLGFGMMRLPRINQETDEIDIEQTKQMIDAYMASGLKYIDTAYVYNGSEDAVRKALVERYPRDSYYLADKLNAGKYAAKDEEEAKKELEISLERTGAGYFDFYLLHAVSKNNIDLYDQYGIWDFVKEKKAEGKIKHYGFSYHDGPELLDEILTKHPDVEFVQLQINYADWNSLTVQSKENYEVCVKHNKPVVVMEPIKGGTLANPPEKVREVLHDANPEVSIASWAVRYVASLPNVMVVLSGMSNMEQMEDNLSYMKDFKPLDESEHKVIENAQEILDSIEQIKCTACHYCTPGCPMKIQIPEIFAAMNRKLIFNNEKGALWAYNNAIKDHGKASECIQCGACEGACPQQLPIRDLLVQCAQSLEK